MHTANGAPDAFDKYCIFKNKKKQTAGHEDNEKHLFLKQGAFAINLYIGKIAVGFQMSVFLAMKTIKPLTNVLSMELIFFGALLTT